MIFRQIVIVLYASLQLLSVGASADKISQKTGFESQIGQLSKLYKSHCRYYPATRRCNGSEDPKELSRYSILMNKSFVRSEQRIQAIEANLVDSIFPFSGRAPLESELIVYRKQMAHLDGLSRDKNPVIVSMISQLAVQLQSLFLDLYKEDFNREAQYLEKSSVTGPIFGYVAGTYLLNKLDHGLSTSKIFLFIRQKTPVRYFAYLAPLAGGLLVHKHRRFGARAISAPPSPAHYIHFNYAGGGSLRDELSDIEEVMSYLQEASGKADTISNSAGLTALLAAEGVETAAASVKTGSGVVGVLAKLKYLRITPISLVVGLSVEYTIRSAYRFYEERKMKNELVKSLRKLSNLKLPNSLRLREAAKAIFRLNILEAYYVEDAILKMPLYRDILEGLSEKQGFSQVDYIVKQTFHHFSNEKLDLVDLKEYKQQLCREVKYGRILAPGSELMYRRRAAVDKRLIGRWRGALESMHTDLLKFSQLLNGLMSRNGKLIRSGLVGSSTLTARAILIEKDISAVERLIKLLKNGDFAERLNQFRKQLIEDPSKEKRHEYAGALSC